MKTISLIFLFSFTLNSYAQSSTTEIDYSSKLSDYEQYLGFNFGSAFGEVGYGVTAGQFLTEKNILELSYKTWNNSEVSGVTNASGAGRLTSNGTAISVSNKYFFYKSFNLNAGAFYRRTSLNVPTGLDLLKNGQPINDREISDLGGFLSLGNHWFGKRWSFAADWISYSPKVVKLKEIDGIQIEDLRLFNFLVSYSF